MTTTTDTQVSTDLHVHVGSTDLIEALADVNVLPSRGRKVLDHAVRLDTTGGSLVISRAQDRVQTEATITNARITGTGVALVSAPVLTGMVRAIGRGHGLTLHPAADRILTVAGGNTTYTLPHVPDPDGAWPTPWHTPDPGVTIPADTATALAATAVAANRDLTLPVLAGIYLHERDGRLVAAATDRFRLAMVESGVAAPAGFGLIVPTPTFELAARLARRDGSPIELTYRSQELANNLISLSIGRTVLRVAGPQAEYPKVNSLWPTTVASTEMDVSALRDAILRVAVVARRNPVVIQLQTDGLALLSDGNRSPGEARAATDIPYSGPHEPREVALNVQFLLDGIKAVGGTRVQIDWASDFRPLVLSDANATTSGLRYLLMPVRLHPRSS